MSKTRRDWTAEWDLGGQWLLRNLRWIDPRGSKDRCELHLIDGRIAAIGDSLSAPDARTLDLDGLALLPGLFDMHVHFREPGGEDSETIATGAKAAARGGFTGVAAMPNTPTRCDQRSVVDLIQARAREACGTAIHPVAALTKNLEGQLLTEMWELKEAGAVAVSDDGFPVDSSEVMRRGMEYARMCGLPVLGHCEDRALKGKGVMHEGYWSTVLGLRGIPRECEEIGVARDLALAKLSGAQFHVCHVSTKGGVELVRRAKERGLSVTAETAPHYLTLTDECLRTYDTSFKMNPPLRTWEDVQALRAAVLDGVIDVIATDHAPHAKFLKDAELDQAPFGVIGLETSLAVCLKALVHEEGMPMEDLVERMSIAPRRLLGLPAGGLEVGALADFTLVDLDAEWMVDADRFASLGRNCPFEGWKLRGEVVWTVASGRSTYAARSLTALGNGVPDLVALTGSIAAASGGRKGGRSGGKR